MMLRKKLGLLSYMTVCMSVFLCGCTSVNESPTRPSVHTHHFQTKYALQEATCEKSGLCLDVCDTCGFAWMLDKIPCKNHLVQGVTCQRCWKQIPEWDETKVMLTERIVEENGLSLSGDVVIPEFVLDNGVKKQVIGIGTSLFYNNTKVTSVQMPDSVIAIQDFAFHGCSNLQSVRWSKNLTFIGRAAFQLCSKLQYTSLPDSVEYIQNFAFNHSGVWNTDSVHVPSHIESLGENPYYGSHMFYDCGQFSAYDLSSKNLHYRIQDGVLYSREGVCVSIPPKTVFESHTFAMPVFMTSFAELAGNRNGLIQTVVLSDKYRLDHTEGAYPSYFNNTGNNLSVGLYGYTNVQRYETLPSNPVYTSIDGVLYNKDKNILLAVPNGYMGVLELPEGIVEWKDDAMWLEMVAYFGDGILSGISEIKIPSTLSKISEDTIAGLNDLSHKFGTKLTVSEENTGLMIRDGDLVRK